jgi:hypothetical protein
MPRAYPKGELLLVAPLGYVPAFSANVELAWKGSSVANTSAYYEQKKKI